MARKSELVMAQNGKWYVDESAAIEVRPAIYDTITGKLHIGDGESGHRAAARATGLGDRSTKELIGLLIFRKDGKLYFINSSGWYPGELTEPEQSAIVAALNGEYQMPVAYGIPPKLGVINRPGGSISSEQ